MTDPFSTASSPAGSTSPSTPPSRSEPDASIALHPEADSAPPYRAVSFDEHQVNFQSLIEKATDIVVILDSCGIFRYVSPSTEGILGYTSAETVGQPVENFVHPVDLPAVQGTIAAALAQPGVSQRLSDYRVRHGDGSWRFFDAVTTNLLDDSAVRGIVVNCHDITERRLADRVLIERARLSKLEAEVGAALASGGSLSEVLQRCTQTIAGALQVPFVRVWTYNREARLLELRASAGQHSLVAEFPTYIPIGASLVGAIAQSRQPYLTNCTATDPNFEARDWLDSEQVVAFAGYPLIVDDQLVGVMALFGRRPMVSAEHGALGWIASVLAMAIDRAWAREALMSRREALLFRLAGQIRQSLDVEVVLQAAVQEIRSLLHVDRCLFLNYCPRPVNKDVTFLEQSYWEVAAESAQGSLPSFVGKQLHGLAAGVAPLLLQWEIVCTDEVVRPAAITVQEFLAQLSAGAALILPVQGSRTTFLGAVACVEHRGDRVWSESEVGLLRGVCDQLAIALDQAALYTDAQDKARQARDQADRLAQALDELQSTQMQLFQSEKMSSLGQMVAGIAHEINNPIAVVHGNLKYARQYLAELLRVIDTYRSTYPEAHEAIDQLLRDIDLTFVRQDFTKLLEAMGLAAERIRQIVLSLRNFARLDRAGMKPTNLHECLDETLTLLRHRLEPHGRFGGIQLEIDRGELPLVTCHGGQMAQVLMNLIGNAIDAMESIDRPAILKISTRLLSNGPQSIAEIAIRDSGYGISDDIRPHLFNPFFTTKPVGRGTGLGLSITYQIVVENHGGTIDWTSDPEWGTEFVIRLPVLLPLPPSCRT
ncbi:GAF domain-containing protein [Limnothrix sp. FACHB-881]|uniref:GAF domain-containing protein n=1 Tax=Limnothrix sp. FACHB-881 TaxID=2692819 RepID=UPI001686E512|nr:GAF domain-containing protein [Limnothrix sp. FACHB-881]MBD2635715.1 GAF domain-containing protein [Limnothrix sp. FACHB-881]